jgi:hypothetical protein
MVANNHGHVFNVASMSAFIPPAGIADYSASKAGIVAFHEVNLRSPPSFWKSFDLNISKTGTWLGTSIST